MKQSVVVVLTVFFLISLCMGNANAGVFASGGGESRTIDSVAPERVYNSSRQPIFLTGRFSNKKGDRRVVISGRRIMGSIPLTSIQWGARRISATLPRNLTEGDYQISLEKFSRSDRSWHKISNYKTVRVIAGAVPANRDGSPHNAPISVMVGQRDSICDGAPIRIWIDGGPFQRSGRNYRIGAELRAMPRLPLGRLASPRVSIVSGTRLMVSIPRCSLLQPSLELRLTYQDGSRSNWISVADPRVSRACRPPTEGLNTEGLEPLRAR
jgi:hypothetical protein